MQDLLDRKHPPICANDDDDEDKDEGNDGYVPRKSNSKINKATEEFDGLESCKHIKYRPPKRKTTACTVLSAVDITGSKTEEIIDAPV